MSSIKTLKEVEREAIINAIKKIGSINKAADALGIGHTTIYRKLKEYGFSVGRMNDEVINSHIET